MKNFKKLLIINLLLSSSLLAHDNYHLLTCDEDRITYAQMKYEDKINKARLLLDEASYVRDEQRAINLVMTATKKQDEAHVYMTRLEEIFSNQIRLTVPEVHTNLLETDEDLDFAIALSLASTPVPQRNVVQTEVDEDLDLAIALSLASAPVLPRNVVQTEVDEELDYAIALSYDLNENRPITISQSEQIQPAEATDECTVYIGVKMRFLHEKITSEICPDHKELESQLTAYERFPQTFINSLGTLEYNRRFAALREKISSVGEQVSARITREYLSNYLKECFVRDNRPDFRAQLEAGLDIMGL